MFGFSWVGMETVAMHILPWLGVSRLPKDVLSGAWSWQSIILHTLTFFASAALILYVLEGNSTGAITAPEAKS